MVEVVGYLASRKDGVGARGEGGEWRWAHFGSEGLGGKEFRLDGGVRCEEDELCC